MSVLRRNTTSGEIEFSEAKWTPWGTIDCLVTFDATGEVIPFHATPWDDIDYGVELFNMISTNYSNIIVPCPQSEIDEALGGEIRAERDALLSRSDWIANKDVDLPNRADWIAYRQALRDISDQVGFPTSVTFPTAPPLTKSVPPA